MAFGQTNTGFQMGIKTPFTTGFSTEVSNSNWNTNQNSSKKNTLVTYNSRYPGFDEEDYKRLEQIADAQGVTGSKKAQLMDELYQYYYPQVLNKHKLDERQEVINNNVYENGEALLNGDTTANMNAKLLDLSQKAKEKFGIAYNVDDNEVIKAMTTKIPDGDRLLAEYINTGNPEILYKAGIAEKPEETFGQKVADVSVGIAQSPGKRGYNMIGQWIDRLGKRGAEQLQGTDLANWVQNKAIELFGEDEVRAYQQEMKKREEEGTLFKGREATDIRTPLLGEERANNKYTKAGEVVGDIASGIALTAPIGATLAPAITAGTVGDAAMIGALEGGVDTLLTQYGSQGNLDITPTQAILGVAGGILGGVLSNKLANLPKTQQDSIRKEAAGYIDKSIKPTVKGKQSQAAYDKFIDDTLDITDRMSQNKKILEYTDDAGNMVKGELPKNLRETSDALGNMKKYIYDQYNALAKKAGDAGAKVNLNKVYDKLDDLANNNAVNLANPGLKNTIETYKDQLLQYSDDLGNISIKDAQDTMQYYNKILDAYFKNPGAMATDTSKNIVVANLKRGLADAVDDSMDDALNASINNGSKASDTYKYWKDLYSKIKTIEDEVSKRALTEARKNTKGLSTDIIDALAGGNLVEGLLTQNPSLFVKGAVMKGINAYNKYLNSPDTQIRNLFNLVDKVNNPNMWQNATSTIGNTVRSVAQSSAPLIPDVVVPGGIVAGDVLTNE